MRNSYFTISSGVVNNQTKRSHWAVEKKRSGWNIVLLREERRETAIEFRDPIGEQEWPRCIWRSLNKIDVKIGTFLVEKMLNRWSFDDVDDFSSSFLSCSHLRCWMTVFNSTYWGIGRVRVFCTENNSRGFHFLTFRVFIIQNMECVFL